MANAARLAAYVQPRLSPLLVGLDVFFEFARPRTFAHLGVEVVNIRRPARSSPISTSKHDG